MNNKNLKAFEEYVNGFDISEPMIHLKLHHSIRVADIAEEIGAGIFHNNEIIDLCYNIGLLHDVGRFPQWTKYNSFNDLKTVDHADYSCDMLFGEAQLIRAFSIAEKWQQYLMNAIKYHNKLKIDVTELRAAVKENNLDYVLMLTLCKIIRDADKLDIFKIFIKNPTVERAEEYEKTGLSSETMEEFRQHKTCNRKTVRTLLDRAIFLLALPYDLNFDGSKRLFGLIAKDYARSIVDIYSTMLTAEDKKVLDECASEMLSFFNVK